MEVLRVKTGRRTQLVDVTEQVERAVATKLEWTQGCAAACTCRILQRE